MSKRFLMGLAIAGVAAFGIGAVVNPRYIEELRIGGGYEDANGGIDFDALGNAWISGDVTIDGTVTGTISATVDPADITAGGATTGQVMTYDGANWGPGDSGAGDVVGPGSSTANTFPLFADGSGKLLTTSTFSTSNVGRLDEAETIAANWANTANPWADNEVSDTLTVGASGSVNDAALSADVSKLGATIESAEITDGTIALADTAITGTPTGSKFVRDDWTLAVPSGGGDVLGPGTSVDLNLAGFSGTGGDTLYDAGIGPDDIAVLSDAETIAANWVNTENPWADNEVSDTITVGALGSVSDAALSANVSLLGSGVNYSELDFSGTPSADTFARGDGTWAAPPTFIECMAAAGKPCTTNGASEPAADANDNWSIAMDTGEYAYWIIVLPSQFSGSVTNIDFYWYQSTTTGAVTWKIQGLGLGEGAGVNTAWGSDTSASPDTADDVDKQRVTSLSSTGIFGNDANGNKLLKIRIGCTYASGGVVHFVGCKLEY